MRDGGGGGGDSYFSLLSTLWRQWRVTRHLQFLPTSLTTTEGSGRSMYRGCMFHEQSCWRHLRS